MSKEVLKWFKPEVREYLKEKKLSPTISNIRRAILVTRAREEKNET